MGYGVRLCKHHLKIKKENTNALMEQLKYFATVKLKLDYVDRDKILRATNIEETFNAIRYPLKQDENGDYLIDCFDGENLGDDFAIFSNISNFIEDKSFLRFVDDDGDKFEYIFNKGVCCKVNMSEPERTWSY